jgi:putative transposase
MTNTSTTSPTLQSEAGTRVHLLDNWFDAMEVELRERVLVFIQAMIESELETALARPRYGRRPTADVQNGDGPKGIPGHRHGHRSRSLMGTFGRVESVAGKTTEWNSSAVRAYQRRTKQCELTSGEPSKPIR